MPATRLVSGIKLAQYSKALFSLTLLLYMTVHGRICSTYKAMGVYILLTTFGTKWLFLIWSEMERSKAKVSVEARNNHLS